MIPYSGFNLHFMMSSDVKKLTDHVFIFLCEESLAVFCPFFFFYQFAFLLLDVNPVSNICIGNILS